MIDEFRLKRIYYGVLFGDIKKRFGFGDGEGVGRAWLIASYYFFPPETLKKRLEILKNGEKTVHDVQIILTALNH
jgi:hypothetical protein